MYLKKKSQIIITIILLTFLCFCSSTNNSHSIGKWKNVDSTNKKINIINISKINGKIWMEAWGKLNDDSVYWGKMVADIFVPADSFQYGGKKTALKAIFKLDTVQNTIVFYPIKQNYLANVSLKTFKIRTKFLDTSSHTFYNTKNKIKKPQKRKKPKLRAIKPTSLTANTIDEFVDWAIYSKSSEFVNVKDSISKARGDSKVIKGLIKSLDECISKDFGKSLMILGILGELKSQNAIETFNKIIWKKAPDDEHILDQGVSKKAILQMQAVKAVECLAYLKLEESDKLIFDIMKNHESKAIRSSAINAYLYNNGDSQEARQKLKALIKTEDFIYLDRIRLVKSITRDEFYQRLKLFYKKYPESLPPNIDSLK